MKILVTALIYSSLTVFPTLARTIPVTVTVKSINDIHVSEGQDVKIGTVLAPIPLEPDAPKFTSKASSRKVTKQKAKLEKVKQLVEKHELPEIFIKHEKAVLDDLRFEDSEEQTKANLPGAYKETVYKSPINGQVERIIIKGGNNGHLSVDILIDTTED